LELAMTGWRQNGVMARWLAGSPWRASAFALALLLYVAIHSAAFQPPVPQPDRNSATELALMVAPEKDSYDIYSIVLLSDVPSQWHTSGWAIKQETRGYPMCLEPAKDQESTYRSVIEDYVMKNKSKLVLQRNLDLPNYVLLGPREVATVVARMRKNRDLPQITWTAPPPDLPFQPSVLLQLSIVGFNQDRTRALVSVGYDCGSCGGGGYHLLVKKDGKWAVDREYRGGSCGWAS
jgi:hypothetical protein